MFKYILFNFLRKKGWVFLIAILPLSLWAQNPIPNPGFENWSGGEPDNWLTSNVQPTLIPVTQSPDAHSGNSSARLEVLDGGGFPWPAWLYAGTSGLGFPCNQRHANVAGYYKFTPQPNTSLTIYAQMLHNGVLIGNAVYAITDAAPNWTQFMVPINYFAAGNPDTCRIDFYLFSETNTGAIAYVDDIQYSGISTSIADNGGTLPSRFKLEQNYPNPFNPTTTIEFFIPETAPVQLVVYNQLGERVAGLVNSNLRAGVHRVEWQARDFPSGVYFYKITAGNFSDIRKMVLLK